MYVPILAEALLKPLHSGSLITKNFDPDLNFEDYILGRGDYISIEFPLVPEFTGIYPINDSGRLNMPRIKNIYVEGLTLFDLQKTLLNEYEKYLIEPEITVDIIKFKSLKVEVYGEVRVPGYITFPLLLFIKYP